jgi:hypothetical protein
MIFAALAKGQWREIKKERSEQTEITEQTEKREEISLIF